MFDLHRRVDYRFSVNELCFLILPDFIVKTLPYIKEETVAFMYKAKLTLPDYYLLI